MLSRNYFTGSERGLRFVIYFMLFLFVFFVGTTIASVCIRWKTTELIAFFILSRATPKS
jgi:hypothetical protein